mmetsp:Transcript_21502/g.31218  ORF Transcript_21502/g.31218 Transcript_21502/m.31218 type:complete len:375 (-) Transcript_21502:63-1187(-)
MTDRVLSAMLSALQSRGVKHNDSLDNHTAHYIVNALTDSSLSINDKMDVVCNVCPAVLSVSASDREEVLRDLISLSNKCEGSAKGMSDISNTEPQNNSSVSTRFRDCLCRHDVDSDTLDDAILDYIVEVCGDPNMPTEDAAEVICTYIPDLCGSKIALELVDISRDTPVAPSQCSSGHVLSQSKKENNVKNPETVSETVSQEDGMSCDDPVDSNVMELQQIVPHVDKEIISYVYNVKFCRNILETGQFLLENSTDDDIERLRSALTEHEEKLKNDAAEKRRRDREMKNSIFRRYGEQVVHTNKVTKHQARSGVTEVAYKRVAPGNSKIRYRDGKVASTKGEKIIVEKNPKDDYDGGSRGRVKTKGKRGPGFVFG